MNKFAYSLSLLLLAFTAWAQPYAPTAEDKALLWKITEAGVEEPSYLYGTIHLIGKDDYFLTEATQQAFESVRHVAFEIDMAEMTDMSKLMPLMMKAFMSSGTTLEELLTEEEYEMVSAHFEKIGLPMMFVNRIKPMFLSMLGGEGMFDMDNLMGGGGESSTLSYEMEFMSMAQERKMSVEGLETAVYQMSMFDSIPYSVQAKMLVDAVKGGGENSEDQFKEMVDLYKAQDITAMLYLMDGEGGIAGYEDLLLVQRNRNWIPVMADMMKQRPTFFAVGAGHLAGEEGVIALLRKAGYTVEPLY